MIPGYFFSAEDPDPPWLFNRGSGPGGAQAIK